MLSQSENEQKNLSNRGGHSVADARHLCGLCNFAYAKQYLFRLDAQEADRQQGFKRYSKETKLIIYWNCVILVGWTQIKGHELRKNIIF
jgi:hypothetical protein